MNDLARLMTIQMSPTRAAWWWFALGQRRYW